VILFDPFLIHYVIFSIRVTRVIYYVVVVVVVVAAAAAIASYIK
jgi:hypothetical protein